MSHLHNEQQHGYVDEPLNPRYEVRLWLALAVLVLVIFMLAGLWYELGFTWAFSLFCAACISTATVAVILHINERRWWRGFLQSALHRGHSIEVKTARQQVRTISPWTVPAGPLTIKDVNIGDQAQLAPVLPVAPPCSQVAEQVGPGHLFLGQRNAGPIWGDITSLLSTVIAGRPGTGTSTNLRSVCGQLLIIGGQPVLFDPHGSILDQLGSSFDCAETPREIAEY